MSVVGCSKPKYVIDVDRDSIGGWFLIERAACILNENDLKDQARGIHQEASVCGYDYYFALKILKKYFDV